MNGSSWLKLYPRAWRERYGEEFTTLLEHHALGPRLVMDILAGALDARLAPQPQLSGTAGAAVEPEGGRIMRMLSCAASEGSRRDQAVRAGLMMLGSLVYAALYLWASWAFGQAWVDAAFFALLPWILTLPMSGTYRCCSTRSRVLLIAAVVLASCALGLLALWQ